MFGFLHLWLNNGQNVPGVYATRNRQTCKTIVTISSSHLLFIYFLGTMLHSYIVHIHAQKIYTIFLCIPIVTLLINVDICLPQNLRRFFVSATTIIVLLSIGRVTILTEYYDVILVLYNIT